MPTTIYNNGLVFPDINFKECGNDVEIHAPISLIKPEKMTLGSHIIIGDYSVINGGDGLHIGHHVHISANCTIIGGGYTIIEDFVTIGYGVRLIVGSELVKGEGLCNPTIPTDYRAMKREHIWLQKHVFLGANVVIHPGITIGEGSVVGSGSVVTRNLDPWGIYMGQPAGRKADREKYIIISKEKQLLKSEGLQNTACKYWMEG